MKHLRITRLSRFRAIRRWPGRIYRNNYVRELVTIVTVWEFVYFGTIWVYGRYDPVSLDLLTWSGLCATLLWLTCVTIGAAWKSRQFLKQGVEHHRNATRRYALGVLAHIHARHGGIDSIPAPDNKRAVRCQCGQFIGLTPDRFPGSDPKVITDWEKHVTDQVKTVMDKFEGELDDRNAGRSASI